MGERDGVHRDLQVSTKSSDGTELEVTLFLDLGELEGELCPEVANLLRLLLKSERPQEADAS